MTPETTLPPLIASTVRHGLTALAGMLVARGLLSVSSGGFVEAFIGIVLGGIGFGWSLARAGKMGSQAKTIALLMDHLMGSVPADSVMVAPAVPVMLVGVTQAADTGPVGVTQAADTGPPSPWPEGHPNNQPIDPATGWPVNTTIDPATGHELGVS